MNLRSSAETLISSLSLLVAFGCSDIASSPEGAGGTPTVPGGAGAANAAGSNGVVPTAGTTGAGTAGTTGAGTAGTTGAGTAGAGGGSGSGAAGSSSGGASGVAGSAATAGAAGTTGAAGSGPGGPFTVPRGMSAGCGQPPPNGDSPTAFSKHDIAVTGVDPKFIADHPSNPGNNGGYTYTMRSYHLKLPANYDQSKPYAVTFGGGGCGNTSGDSGKGGGQQASGIDSIKIGLSYVYSGGACFEDGYANTPEVPYFDAVMADIKAKYCINLEKVFVGGYSSGAWESVTLGLARGGVIRGIATGAGGLRKDRPMPSGIPMAAILLTGQGDTTNPIDGPTGSALARDEILKTNKCVGTATMPFAPDTDCVQYTGCPAAFPVVWCTPAGGHTGGDGDHWAAVGAFWAGLPAVP